MSTTRLSDKARGALEAVKARLISGNVGEIVQMARIARHPNDGMPSYDWSDRNRVIALIQTLMKGAPTMDCRGYRQWQAVGRQVQKGSGKHTVYILAPITFYKKGPDKQPIIGPDGRKIVSGMLFKSIPVFPVWCTEGDELPVFDYEPEAPPPLKEVADAFGITVRWFPTPAGSDLGRWSPSSKSITLGVHSPDVFFHELGHAVHTSFAGPKIKRGQDPERETIAEFVSCVLSALYGYDRTGNARQYIAHYQGDVTRAVNSVVGTVIDVLAMIEEKVGVLGLKEAA